MMKPQLYFPLLSIFLIVFMSGCNSPAPSTESSLVENPAVGSEEEVQEVVSPPLEVEEVEIPEPEEIVENQIVEEAVEVAPVDEISFVGTIQYIELEGGFFGIIAEDGRKFFPQYLKAGFKKDGLSVHVTGKLDEEVFGIQMWGTPFSIEVIEEI